MAFASHNLFSFLSLPHLSLSSHSSPFKSHPVWGRILIGTGEFYMMIELRVRSLFRLFFLGLFDSFIFTVSLDLISLRSIRLDE